jgi:DNA-binding CsgD family transcriptional regulator
MPGAIVGRELEVEAAAGLAARLEEGPVGLVLAGEAGIGKTTVWLAAVDRVRASFDVVLSARPLEAEADLGFAGLADLLSPLVEGVLPILPDPQRHALAVALLMEEPGPRPLDRRAVYAATLSALRFLAARGPVLIAIDDLQWLDGPSAHALEFAIRRLGDLPVGVLCCERIADGATPKLDLGRALAGDRCIRLSLGPLSLAALHQVLKDQLCRSFPHRTLVRIAGTAGGNPFFALELARSLPADASIETTLALPANLRQLVEDRMAGLPKRARDALVVAAVAGSPTVDLVTSATNATPSDTQLTLERATGAALISVEGSRIRFTHPLYAAGVYTSASPADRRLAHRRLAQLVDDVEEQAHHQALGVDGADEGVAAVLDAAAEHARRRGAAEVAADLTEHARRLTPPDRVADYQRRSVQAAEYHFHAGELRRARQMLEEVLNRASTGTVRANALRLLGEIRLHEDSFPEAIRLFREALDHVGDDPGIESAIELSLTYGMHVRGDFAAASVHASRALTLARRVGEPGSLAEALAVTAIADFIEGRGLDEAKIERALRYEDPHRQVPAQLRPSLIAGGLALYLGQLERCDRLLSPIRRRVVERGQESDLPVVAYFLVWSSCWQGELERAESYAVDAIESATCIESDSLRCWSLGFAAVASAYAGQVELTTTRAEACLALATPTGFSLAALWANWALALLALSQDRAEAADAALAPLAAAFEKHVPEPGQGFFLPDEIEALIRIGRLGQADRLLGRFDEAAKRLERPWALMRAARARALLLAACGDLEAASAQAAEALARCAGLELRIEVARTHLVAGQIERRHRRKGVAADYLGRALEQFDRAGARLWAERARAELARVGLRPSPSGQLTATERRVAELTASGLTNREVAAQLFVSPKTVEANLARVYRKLGVRSRAELGAQLPRIGSLPIQT